jgi:hypothetical protein
MMTTDTHFGRLVSIDAWRDMDGWTWNQSYTLQNGVELADDITPRKLFAWLRENGYLSDYSKGRVRLQDDWPILEIQHKDTFEPIFAFEMDDS